MVWTIVRNKKTGYLLHLHLMILPSGPIAKLNCSFRYPEDRECMFGRIKLNGNILFRYPVPSWVGMLD